MRTPLQRRVDDITERCRYQTAVAVDAARDLRDVAKRLQDRDTALEVLRNSILLIFASCCRACWICGLHAICPHREPALVERWKAGYLE